MKPNLNPDAATWLEIGGVQISEFGPKLDPNGHNWIQFRSHSVKFGKFKLHVDPFSTMRKPLAPKYKRYVFKLRLFLK
jgi:hypothetical protein